MPPFVGRKALLQRLNQSLLRVADSGSGLMLSIRGRRQIGKSTLTEEFLARAAKPSLFFVATKGAPSGEQLRSFCEEVAISNLEAAELFAGTTPGSFEAALKLVAAQVSRPSILVIDELPYLLEAEPTFEGTLQKSWDRVLSKKPILLLVIGSDQTMMERLGSHDRPLYQRMQEMIVPPFSVAELAKLLGLTSETVWDAYLVVGGFPRVAQEWSGGTSLADFLRAQLEDSTSPLVVVGERILNAELPATMQAAEILRVIGAGETTFDTIARRSGLQAGSLARTLKLLINEKRAVEQHRPLSAKPSRLSHYCVADPYLRFWLRFIRPNLDEILRNRGVAVAERILQQWPNYRGRAIEPLLRASIERVLPQQRFGAATRVGSYWDRTGTLEVDLVGTEHPHPPTAVSFIGSIKWREQTPFDDYDFAKLVAHRQAVPGAEHARLVGVSRTGFTTKALDVALGPEELLACWA